MIPNGRDLDMGQASAGLPDVSQAIMQMFQPCTVGIIKSTLVNGRIQTVVQKYVDTQGVRVPRKRPLVISKTGERYWNAQDIYFLSDTLLNADDIFLFNKMQYRVMESQDWTEYGFNQYGCLQDYTKIYEEKPVVIND